MPFEVIHGDVTKIRADAIVNAANTELLPGGGVCGAIFAAAGYQDLLKECMAIGHCDVGKSVITSGYALPAKFIIHTVGPVWQGGHQDEEVLLTSCYKSALGLAQKNGCRSVAFPLISSGIYGYPPDEALQVAKKAIIDYLANNEITVFLILYP